jgi:polyphenol oxidase
MFVWRVLPGRAAARPGAFLALPALESRGIHVAFTNRTGGVSSGDFGSLNLSFYSGDDPELVRANRATALAAIGAAPDAWTSGRQVHETRIVHADAAVRGRGAFDPDDTLPGTDGTWTEDGGIALAVLTADCLPVVIVDAQRRRIAAVHAGWRGLVGGILEGAGRALEDAGSDPGNLRAFVGPAIGPCCYEVGDDVVAAAHDSLGPDVVVKHRDGATHVDLWTGARISLARAGVRDVWPTGLCTRCESHRFYSHRGGATGRQAAVAMLA